MIQQFSNKMRIISFLLIIFIGAANLSAKVDSYGMFTYNIKAEIDGLHKGDTICFEAVLLPWMSLEPAFKVIVDEDGRFSYSGSAYYSQYFFMTYKPLSGKDIISDRMGLPVVIVGESDILIKGNAENIYYSKIEGGVYAEDDKSSSLNILEMLKQVTHTPIEELESFYASLNKEAQKSYFGIFLRQEIDNMAALAPGNDAPDFIVETVDKQQVSLNDYNGYYVLIYNFGLCPGSLMMDKEVSDFYINNKERVKVLGVSEESLNALQKLYRSTDPSEKFMNVDLKPALESMVSHPWIDIENKGDNRQLSIDYALAGTPFFVFISPDGKILLRGFHEAFYKAKNIVEEVME